VLDGWGGLHPFGGAQLNAAGAPYWQGWDIARSAALDGGAGGWVLDGWGGIHGFGGEPGLQPPVYWQGWDIARALVVLADHRSGYVLDGWGGVHAFGSAPPLGGFPYWQGWDIARGLSIHLDGAGNPDGGWVMDGWGGMHAFGAAPWLDSPHYFPGMDVWRQAHVAPDGSGAYQVGRFGLVSPIGGAQGTDWSNFPSWRQWDILRDVVLEPAGTGWTSQPTDRYAASAFEDFFMSQDRQAAGHGALADDGVLDGISGNGLGYNLADCGGPNVTIGDRTEDMVTRNAYQHTILGCNGSWYARQTYFPFWGVQWNWAGENWAETWNDQSLADSAWRTDQGWMNDPAHYQNITGYTYTRVGAAFSRRAPPQCRSPSHHRRRCPWRRRRRTCSPRAVRHSSSRPWRPAWPPRASCRDSRWSRSRCP
jgi:hypothetical protein